MAIRPTPLPVSEDVILVRECWIEDRGGEVGPLTLSVLRPKRIGAREVEGALRFECWRFDKTLTLNGGDDVQVLTTLLSVGKAWLQMMKGDGFTVWWREKGDFDFFDFWSHQPRPSEFCLQSAYQDAALEAFLKATEGRFLLPSHRVAIEPDRPGITTYAVQPDGTDVVAGLIGPDEMKDMSPDQVCRRLGRMILNGSEAGRQLLAGRRASPDDPEKA